MSVTSLATAAVKHEEESLNHALHATHEIIMQMERSKRNTETLINQLPEAIFLFDNKLRILRFNKAAEQLMGANSNLLLSPIDQLFDENRAILFRHLVSQAQSHKGSILFEMSIDRYPVRTMRFQINRFAGLSDRRGPIYYLVATDISAVISLQSQLNLLLDNIPFGMLTLNDKGQVVAPFSKFSHDLLECTSVSGMSFTDLVIHPASTWLEPDAHNALSQATWCVGREVSWYESFANKLPEEICWKGPVSKKKKWLKLDLHPIKVDEKVSSLLIVLEDITRRKKNRHSLGKSESQRPVSSRQIQEILGTDEQTLNATFSKCEEMVITMNNDSLSCDFDKVKHTLLDMLRMFEEAGLASVSQMILQIKDHVSHVTAGNVSQSHYQVKPLIDMMTSEIHRLKDINEVLRQSHPSSPNSDQLKQALQQVKEQIPSELHSQLAPLEQLITKT